MDGHFYGFMSKISGSVEDPVNLIFVSNLTNQIRLTDITAVSVKEEDFADLERRRKKKLPSCILF